jgi:O-antigen polymerase
MLPQNLLTFLLFPLGLLLFSNKIAFKVKTAVFALGIFVCLYAQSRGMLLAYSLSFALISMSWIRKKSKVLFLLPFIFLTVSFLYFIKPESANGRLLIWKIILSHNQHLLWGNGAQSFQELYPAMQHDYFKLGGSENEKMVADLPSFAFNEYLQFIFEHGLVLFAAMACFFAALLRFFVLHETDQYLKRNVLFSLCIILFSSCFTYLLHYTAFLLVLFALTAIMLLRFVANRFKINGMLTRSLVFFLMLNIAILFVFKLAKEKKEKRLIFMALHQMQLMPRESEEIILKNYSNHPEVNENKLNLFKFYLASGDTTSALNFMHHCIGSSKYHYQMMMLSASLYFEKQAYPNALVLLECCKYMLPNRFEPLFREMMVYKELGNRQIAKKLAAEILSKKVKIKSEKIVFFKTVAKQILSY